MKSLIVVATMLALCGNVQAYDLVNNNDGTTHDNETGLTWMTAPVHPQIYWDDAKAYCESLELGGYSDWRLPTMTELNSILDGNNKPMNIATGLINDTYKWNWSSEERIGTRAWALGFYDDSGWISWDKWIGNGVCRCVRSEPQPEVCYNEDDLDIVFNAGAESVEVPEVCYDEESMDTAFINGMESVVCESNTADKELKVKVTRLKVRTNKRNTVVKLRTKGPAFEKSAGKTNVTILLESSNGKVVKLSGYYNLKKRQRRNTKR